MRRASALRALVLATATLVPLDLGAQPALAPTAQSGTADAIRVLLDQATYWRRQSQPAKADEAVGRVLVLDPNNPDALAMAAQAAAERGDKDATQTALARLQATRPDDPRIGGVERSLKAGLIDATQVAAARALAKDGNPGEAVAAYRRAFQSDTPPPALATEFYQALGEASDDWRVPQAGLAAAVRANPENLQAQLAYAELLTYHSETRQEGMDRLAKLAQDPAIADRASKDLRQALFWLPPGSGAISQYDVYLAKHPDDAEIAKLATVAKADSGDNPSSGFDALQDNKVADAERLFAAALKANPADVDATIGMALVRLRERRDAEGKDLLRRAIELDPSRAEQYQPLIDGDGATADAGFSQAKKVDYGGVAARRIRSQYARVTALTNHGEFDQAEALLRKLTGRRANAGARAYLADIQARGGHLDQAEAGYRGVLARSPRNVQALGGLAGVLSRQGKQAEADTLYAQAASLPGGAAVGRGHADTLRRQAEQMSDPLAQIGLFRAALAADPANPWLRLALARALHHQGEDTEAREAMATVGAGPGAPLDDMQAAIYFAHEMHDDAQAIRLVDRLPRRAQAPGLLAIRGAAHDAEDLREARALGGAAERARLLSLSAQPDPTGQRVGSFGNELIRLGDKPGAREAVRLALASQPATPEQRIAYAGLLLGAGYPGDAKAITQGVSAPAGEAAQRLGRLRDSIAVVSSDRLNGAGNRAAAYDQLAPRLAASPDSPDLNLALSRLYAADKRPAKAAEISEGLLQQNPDDLNVRSSVVNSAVAAGDYRRAAGLAQQTTEQFPEEPQAWLDLANVERARGNAGRALQDLRTAKALREKQLQSRDGALASSSDGSRRAAVEPLRRRYARYAQYVPANTASDASPDALPEPITRRYAQYAPPGSDLPIEAPLATRGATPGITAGYAPYSPVTPASAFVPSPAPRAVAQGAPPRVAAPSAQPGVAQDARPSMMAEGARPLDAPALGNPFRPGATPLPTPDEPSVPGSLEFGRSSGPVSADPLTAQIDQGIQQVTQEVAPRLEGSLSLRGRTGAVGLERLFEVAAPVEASYSPNGFGRLKVVVTPTYLYSGQSSLAYDQGRFGTNPLGAFGPAAAALRTGAAFGTALDVGYAYGMATADVGASPIGFQQRNVVGGIELAPKLSSTLTLRAVAERRVVTDSILSYAGMRDVRTGEKWGGVTRNRGHLQVEGSFGLGTYYAGAGGGLLVGSQVASNSEMDAGAGASYPVWRTATKEVRLGADLVYFGYDKNLGGFTVGQGGYFSPQQYYALLFPASYRDQVTPDLTYTVGGSIGYQSFRSKSSAAFPADSARQAQLVQLAGGGTSLATTFAGTRGSGLAGGARAEVDYRLYQNLHVGARAGADRSGAFTEGTGLVYARYLFDGAM